MTSRQLWLPWPIDRFVHGLPRLAGLLVRLSGVVGHITSRATCGRWIRGPGGRPLYSSPLQSSLQLRPHIPGGKNAFHFPCHWLQHRSLLGHLSTLNLAMKNGPRFPISTVAASMMFLVLCGGCSDCCLAGDGPLQAFNSFHPTDDPVSRKRQTNAWRVICG